MAEHRTLNPQVEGSIPSAPIRAISHEVALFFARRQGAGTRPIPLALHTRSIRPIPLRSIRALRRLCARACALARIRRRLRPFRPIPLALHTGSTPAMCSGLRPCAHTPSATLLPPKGAIRSASYSSISCLCLPKQGYLRTRCSPPHPDSA